MRFEDRATEEALFRYGVISPLLEPNLDRAEQSRRRREILGRPHALPGGGYRQVSARTLRRWLKAYREGGFEALKPKPRRDRSRPRAISPEVLAKAVALKEELPERSVRQIVDMLAMDPETPVGPGELKVSTLARQLRLLGKTRRLLARPARAFRRFEQEGPNRLWQADVCHGPWLADPQDPAKKRRTYLVAFLDDYSRLVCHAQFYFAEDLVSLLHCFKQAILKRGVPAKVYCDNGAVFQSRQFALVCANLGIRHLSARPYAPEGKGKVERFFGTVQRSFIPEVVRLNPKTLEELNEFFWAWLEQFYHHHVHAETGQTPATRFAKGPGEIRLVDPLALTAAFLWREKRKVDKTGCFSFQGNRYEAPPHLAGKTVEIRYDPFDLSRLQIFHEGQAMGEARPLELSRKTDERVEAPPVPEETRSVPRLSYLELLRKRHTAALKEELGRIRFYVPGEEEEKDRV
jgi:transposase InsO family protein